MRIHILGNMFPSFWYNSENVIQGYQGRRLPTFFFYYITGTSLTVKGSYQCYELCTYYSKHSPL